MFGSRPFALVFPQLCCRKRRAASAASPARKRAAHQPWPITCTLLWAGTNRQNQLTTAVRTFAFLHSPHSKFCSRERIGRLSQCVHRSTSALSTMPQISAKNRSILTVLRSVPLLPPRFERGQRGLSVLALKKSSMSGASFARPGNCSTPSARRLSRKTLSSCCRLQETKPERRRKTRKVRRRTSGRTRILD